MDPDSLSATVTNVPRKVKYQPKGPPRRERPVLLPKSEKVEDDVDAAKAQELLRRFNEASMKGNPKAERKVAPSRVAFGFGGSASLKSYGLFKGINKPQGSSSDGGGMEQRVEKEYKEPWDYYTNYPVSLPLRRPYSGNPELLDQEEFGEASQSLTYDENSSNPAIDLGLMEENPEESLLFLQLPANMPMLKQSATSEGNETANSKTSKSSGKMQKACLLDDLPAGFMGKMLVYRSGAVKLKLGETLYDVSAGLDCRIAQDAVVVNTEEKHCCVMGELNKRAIVTPDVDSILDSTSEL